MLSAARQLFKSVLPRSAPPLNVEMGEVHGWRTHAKLAIRRDPRSGSPTLGLFQARSHTLLGIPQCAVHAPEIRRVTTLVEGVLRDGGISAYSDETGRGDARYALLTVQRSTRRVRVVLVWNAGNWKEANPLAAQVGAQLWRRGGAMLHSVWFNWHSGRTNAIVNPEPERFYRMHGARDLMETVCGVQVAFPPHAFRQANLDAFETLVLPRLLRYVPEGARMAELCAGVGVIGLVAAKKRHLTRLHASEIHGGAENPFWQAMGALKKGGVTTRMEFVVGADDETLGIIKKDTDVLVVDPPRGGLSEAVVTHLTGLDANHGLRRIIYLSCGFEALRRDASGLCGHGAWRVGAAHLFALFPGSDHLETLVVFERGKGSRGRATPGDGATVNRKTVGGKAKSGRGERKNGEERGRTGDRNWGKKSPRNPRRRSNVGEER